MSVITTATAEQGTERRTDNGAALASLRPPEAPGAQQGGARLPAVWPRGPLCTAAPWGQRGVSAPRIAFQRTPSARRLSPLLGCPPGPRPGASGQSQSCPALCFVPSHPGRWPLLVWHPRPSHRAPPPWAVPSIRRSCPMPAQLAPRLDPGECDKEDAVPPAPRFPAGRHCPPCPGGKLSRTVPRALCVCFTFPADPARLAAVLPASALLCLSPSERSPWAAGHASCTSSPAPTRPTTRDCEGPFHRDGSGTREADVSPSLRVLTASPRAHASRLSAASSEPLLVIPGLPWTCPRVASVSPLT